MVGADRYLDAEDMLEVRDKKSIMVWMSEVWNCAASASHLTSFLFQIGQLTLRYYVRH